MGFRRLISKSLLNVFSPAISDNLAEIKSLDFADTELTDLRDKKLAELLKYCYEFVPYYKEILSDSAAVVDGKVRLDNFTNIPPLTKSIIREQGDNLLPNVYNGKGRYENTSGGSTGEPVRFFQDSRYEQWNTANKLHFNIVLGKLPGDAEIKLWGSDRDILQGNLSTKERLINFFYNRLFFNCYEMNEKKLEQLRVLNNSFKPRAYWAYMEAANELADYIKATGKHFYPPKFIISTIGVLTQQVREKIENALGCDVYNQYGSRELGAIACECLQKDGLHTFPWSHHVEILNQQLEPVEKGEEGEIFVTPLENYAMPLLRYAVGDVAVSGGYECGCGRKSFKLGQIKGRTLGYFVKPDNSLAHSHFIVQMLFFKNWISRFQVVQERVDYLRIIIQKQSSGKPSSNELEQIKQNCRKIMGSGCRIGFEFTEKINPTQSGKYLYTICKVQRR